MLEPAYTQRNAEVVRAELGAPICPHIRINADFDWDGADFLCVKAYYGTDVPMKSRRISKPAVASDVEIDLDSWKVWDAKRFEWREATFKFCDLKYSRELSERWSESKRLSIGTICISLQRMTLGDNTVKYMWPEMKFEPILEVGSNVSVFDGIDHAICIAKSVKVDKSELFDMGSETRLEGPIGNWFNFRFNYRSESYLQSQSLEPLNSANYLTGDTQGSQAGPQSIRPSTEQEPLGRGHRRKFRASDSDDLGGPNARFKLFLRNSSRTKRAAPNPKHNSPESNITPTLKPGRGVSNPTVTKDNLRDRSSSFERSDIRLATPLASSSTISHMQQTFPVPTFLTIPVTRAERIQELKEEEDAVDEMILQQLLVCDPLNSPRQMDDEQDRPKRLSSNMRENSLRHYRPLNRQRLDSYSEESVSSTNPEPLPDDNIRV
ncbi:hypothetical protein MMC27_005126 [Xylographa pallens]|nr:hypothetical protein [Xylographa pallens]